MYSFEDFDIAQLETVDAKSLYQLMRLNYDQFRTYLPVTTSSNESLSASEAYIKRKTKENALQTSLTLALKERSTGEVAGLIILKNIDHSKKQGEFAYCIGEEFWGRGWMSKTVTQMSKHALDNFGIKTFQIITHKTNIASCRVAVKCGFVWKKTLKNEFTPPNGRSLDMELYELYL
tara:strand:- start:45 stop:575 length:531 start_codon:yes stop_codon:yes gene_type:complete